VVRALEGIGSGCAARAEALTAESADAAE